MAYDRLNPKPVVELKPLASSVSIAANTTSQAYSIPTKANYSIGAVTPYVSGSGWGNIHAIVNMDTTSVYFRNVSGTAWTVNLALMVLYLPV